MKMTEEIEHTGPIHAAMIVGGQAVECNEALIRADDTVLLETLATTMPAAIIMETLNNHLIQQNKSSVAYDFGNELDTPVHKKGPSLDLTDVLSSLPIVKEVVANDIFDINNSLNRAVVISERQANFVSKESTKEQVQNVVNAISAVGEIASTVVSEAASAVVAGIISGAASAITDWEKESEEQPLYEIISQHTVYVASGNPSTAEIDESIERLDNLINALKNVDSHKAHIGSSPGFETKLSLRRWCTDDACLVYETLPSVNGSCNMGPCIPLPSASTAIKYYERIKKVWIERKEFSENAHKREYCSCIKGWDHVTCDVLLKLAHQSLEQDMIQEASDYVTVRMQQPGCIKGQAWDRLYRPELCPTPTSVDHLYIDDTSIRIIDGRDDFVKTIVSAALQAKHTVDIATCYIFPNDPVNRYILLDFLPYLAQTRNLSVRLLCDMMPIESFLVRSPIMTNVNPNKRHVDTKSRSGISAFSFLDNLPYGAPPISDRARNTPASSIEFLRQVIDAASSTPNNKYQIQWWCARDSQDKYRVKNHAKCYVFDGGSDSDSMAIIGGSNICPTVEIGNSDLDMVVAGKGVVSKIRNTFDWLWDAMCDPSAKNVVGGGVKDVEHERIDKVVTSTGKFKEENWTDSSCRAAHIQSEPSSAGSDVILRHVLGAIAQAEKTIDICMGHSNKPMALAVALGEAVKRGVRCRLLVNSLFSCDLRVNQRDLFNSVKDLLRVAPGVEVWTTALRLQRKICKHDDEDEEKKEGSAEQEKDENTILDVPPFLHSKYTVIDGKWVAVGSWNVWARSAFYEIEHELLIHSEKIAAKLEDKFQGDLEATSILLTKPEDCDLFCPIGCSLCKPFGPFYT